MVLFTGFKGKNNSSSLLAEKLSPEHLLLTNSYTGLKRDIDSIDKEYDLVVMFGVDTTLTSTVRIENVASLDDKTVSPTLDLGEIANSLKTAGISAVISDTPTAYLCNAAYYHMLNRFSGKAIFIHVPPVKYVDMSFVQKMKAGLSAALYVLSKQCIVLNPVSRILSPCSYP